MVSATPFAGVRVLDLTSGLAGALASAHLGDFGADVVRAGGWEPALVDDLAVHLYANRSKRLCPLEVGTADGLLAVRRLAARADVVVVDSPAATLDRLGLDATTLRAGRPGLVHLWMPGHGMRGRDNALPADDLLLAARTGVSDQQPATKDQPVALAVPLLSYEQGLLGACAIAAAIFSRLRTGAGRAVVVSGLHAVAAMNGTIMVDMPGIIRPFGGSKGAGGLSPNYRAYECRDGEWVFLATLTPAHFLMLLDAIDLMEVMVLPGIDGEFANVRRPEHHAAVVALMEERMRQKDSAEWLAILRSAGVPSAPVSTRATWLDSETVAANQALETLVHAELGTVRLPGAPVVLSLTPGAVVRLPGPDALVEPADVWPGASDVPWGSPTRPGSSEDGGEGHSGPGEGHGAGDELPLHGVRVLDLGTFLAGPFVGQVLVDFGASVVKGEIPGGDGYRLATATFAATNRGKENLLLDMKTDVGRERFFGVVQHMDAVVDNVRYGVPERLGTDYETLRKVNPRVVRCTILGWGEGPQRDTPCFDPLLQASGGLMTAQAGGGQPVLSAMPVHDVAAGTIGAFGIVAALVARERGAEGQHVSTSLTHVSLAMQAGECTVFEGRTPPSDGGEDFVGPSPGHRLYRCADGWLGVLAGDLAALGAAVGAAGRPSGPTTAELEEAFGALAIGEAHDRLAAAGVAGVPVLSRTAIFEDPWLAENDFYVDVVDSDVGLVHTVSGFARWLQSPRASSMTSRAVGEDTTTVLGAAGLLEGRAARPHVGADPAGSPGVSGVRRER